MKNGKEQGWKTRIKEDMEDMENMEGMNRGENIKKVDKNRQGTKRPTTPKDPKPAPQNSTGQDKYSTEHFKKIETYHGRAVPRPARNPSIETVLSDRGVGGDVFAFGGPPAGVETIEIHLLAPGNFREGGGNFSVAISRWR